MKENLFVSASPHITKPNNTTRKIMLDVLISLCPVVIAAVFFFGYAVIINVAVAVAACVGFELLYDAGINKRFKKDSLKTSSIKDCSAAVTGVILALNFPTFVKVDAWNLNFYNPNIANPTIADMYFSFDTVFLLIAASLFAVVVVKMLFGGIGKNFVNPAATGRIFASVIVALAAVQTVGAGLDASTGATWLTGGRITADNTLLFNMFIGNVGSAAVGETSVIAILIGYIYLSVRKVIDFRLPLILVGAAAVFALLFDGVIKSALPADRIFTNMLAHVMSGGLLFGAVYMATDYATNPNTFAGQAIFAVGIALITMLIRVFAASPEGMSYAIVIMNIVTPLIDRYVYPRPFGYEKKKKQRAEKEAA